MLECKPYLSFSKMHGLGNDFIMIPSSPDEISRGECALMADRRHGIGCDQLIFLEQRHVPQMETMPAHIHAFLGKKKPMDAVTMTIVNADGSPAEACGNGTRCAVSMWSKSPLLIQTSGGWLVGALEEGYPTVSMGPPQCLSEHMARDKIQNPDYVPVHVQGFSEPAAVGMGNPHLVFFVPSLDDISFERLGLELCAHSLFPQGVNVEWVKKNHDTHLSMVVYERGAGLTPACATGACASVVASARRGHCPRDVPIKVSMPGGDLWVTYHTDPETVIMHGPVTHVFRGEWTRKHKEIS